MPGRQHPKWSFGLREPGAGLALAAATFLLEESTRVCVELSLIVDWSLDDIRANSAPDSISDTAQKKETVS